jgi:serine/threonine protein kinase
MAFSEHIRLVREISRSSIATVSEGYDERLGRKVLVKTLHRQLARDEDLRQRFEREAQVVASLAHPNVVRIYELHTGDEDLSLIMEYVEGRSLRDLLTEHQVLSPDIAAVVASEILAGLAAAHEKGIVHRDLKPENVLISNRGEVKIADFGLAMVRDLPRLTQTGALVGTPTYMAPEQAAGEEATPRTDLFSLGLILFEMLTGHRLVGGKTLAQSLQNVVNFQPPRFSDYRPQVSPEMERVLARLLDRKPVRRFESAQAARDAVDSVCKDVRVPEVSALLQDLCETSSTEQRTEIQPPLVRQARRGRLFVIAGALVLFVIALLVVIHVAQRKRQPDRAFESGLADTVVSEVSTPSTAGKENEMEEGVGEEIVASEPVRPGPEKVVQRNAVAPPPKQHSTPSDTTGDLAHAVIVGPATLQILCKPYAQVVVDREKVGVTPLQAITLPAGSHRIAFLNEDFPVVVDTIMTLKGGEGAILSVNLFDHVGVVFIRSVSPWAEIFVDGEYVDRTPREEPVLVTLGVEHTIRLENPSFPPWTKRILFTEADTLEVRVDLAAQP